MGDNHQNKFSSAKIGKRPVRDYDPDDYESWLDGEAFAAYCVKVKEAIYAADKPLWVAHINRELGLECKREWTLDAISSLMSIEAIREVPMLLPVRYEPSQQRQVVTRTFNCDDPIARTDRTRPVASAFE